jgi:N-sulfoglucosamine sulfohydrolase
MIKKYSGIFILFSFLLLAGIQSCVKQDKENDTVKRPNILFALSDNQSFPHAGAYGEKLYNTPAFDLVAETGILFQNAFVSSPGCAPSRSSILLGRYLWQNEEAGGHQTLFPQKYIPFTDILKESGYHVGYTGKGCAPFNWKQGGRKLDPAGREYNDIRYEGADLVKIPTDIVTDPESHVSNISTVDYTGNFRKFLSEKSDDEPFFFWYGSREPHTPFEKGSGVKSGKKFEDVIVPGFLPDNETIKIDLMDYAHEIEWFDSHLMEMIKVLEEIGELANTIIIVTSDNGMQFPRSIGNCYEYGLHVPLAISWPDKIRKGRESQDLINLDDLAPTILEIAKAVNEGMLPMSAESFTDILYSSESGIINNSRDAVYAGRERHSSARWMNLGYPQRSIRTHEFLYIWNVYPERWPAGAPQVLNPKNPNELYYLHGLDENGKYTGEAYHDLDNGTSKTFFIENMNVPEVAPYFELAVGKRPMDELYNIKTDPYCLENLASNGNYSDELESLKNKLFAFLKETEDPRIVGPNPDIFENYQRFYVTRPFPRPDWVKN